MIASLLLSCLKVFFCRVADVTLGSMKTILVVKERTLLAALLGFFEVFIWFVVVKDAINSDMPLVPVAVSYALGYATGTYIGGTLAKKLVAGEITVHVVTTERNPAIATVLRDAGYGITVLDVEESEYGGQKNLVLAEFDSKELSRFEKLVKDLDPNAFIIIQETKSALGGYHYRRPGK